MVVLSPAGMRILNRHIYDCKYQLIASSCGSDNIEPGGHLDPPHHVVYEVHPRTIQPISCAIPLPTHIVRWCTPRPATNLLVGFDVADHP